MAKVRKFNTNLANTAQVPDSQKPLTSYDNPVPDIPQDIADRIADSAPVKIIDKAEDVKARGRGNPRKRRYRQKTYSLLQEDVDLIESLVMEIRKSGLYERGRSDIVRAGIRLLSKLTEDEKIQIISEVENLKS